MNKFVDTILVNNQKEILLLKRKDNDDFGPGKWCLPGGHAETDTDEAINARREVYEEAGIVCVNVEKLFNHKFTDGTESTGIYWSGEGWGFKMKPIKLSPREHSEFKWVPITDIYDYDLLNEVDVILKNALAKIEM